MTVPAYNEVTQMSGLANVIFEHIAPFKDSYALLSTAEKVFFAEHTIFVRSLESITPDIKQHRLGDVENLYVNIKADLHATYSRAAVDAEFRTISRALKDLLKLKKL